MNMDSIFDLHLSQKHQVNLGCLYTFWMAWINEVSSGTMEFKVASSRCNLGWWADSYGKLTSMIPAVGTLATVLIGTLNGAEMSPKHYILVFFSPREVKHKRSSIIWYSWYFVGKASRQIRNLDILLKFVVTGFDLYRVLNDYGYS